jgi:hypothetical protein
MVYLIIRLRQTLEKRWEFDKDKCLAFIDLEKAYDSVNRQEIWEELWRVKVSRE